MFFAGKENPPSFLFSQHILSASSSLILSCWQKELPFYVFSLTRVSRLVSAYLLYPSPLPPLTSVSTLVGLYCLYPFRPFFLFCLESFFGNIRAIFYFFVVCAGSFFRWPPSTTGSPQTTTTHRRLFRRVTFIYLPEKRRCDRIPTLKDKWRRTWK